MRSLCSRAASTSSSISSSSQYTQIRIGKCWPDPQHLLHRRPTCADRTQVQTKRSRKHDEPPPSAHMYQGLPFLFVVNFAQVEIKYFKEELFRKHVDCNVAYVTMISGHSRGAAQKAYLYPLWSIPPSCDVHDALPSLRFRNGQLPDATTRWCKGVLTDWL